ncbi:serine/threonine protein kinase [Shigella sonnei]|uniref:serine/threonine protein kinase n=1 Tax=Shigella sonnei TaxID=624 RepID=UPI0006633265|nr:serine/threonine protein kinase [Shigella sonnei]CSE75692.1 serine/threonine protein kinase [Shigella sonnei]
MNNSAFTFQTLHPDTIMDALFEQGIRVDSGLTPLNSYENRVYQFQDEERRRFVVKFYRPERWTADQILEEHQFALQLVNDEVPVAAPVAFNGQTLLNHQGFYFAVFPSVGGRQFEADNIDQTEAVGRYLGRMHQTGHKQLARNGPAIQDLWMLLNGDKAEQRMQLETIIEAYEEFGEFDTAEIGLIEPLRAMRLVYYLAWLMRRWADPAFPKNFPWLTGEDYWLRQTATFIEQAKVLQEPPLQLTPMY